MEKVSLLILAGKSFQAKDFAKSKGLGQDQFEYLSDEKKLQGKKDCIILRIGTSYERKDEQYILDHAKARNIPVIDCHW